MGVLIGECSLSGGKYSKGPGGAERVALGMSCISSNWAMKPTGDNGKSFADRGGAWEEGLGSAGVVEPSLLTGGGTMFSWAGVSARSISPKQRIYEICN